MYKETLSAECATGCTTFATGCDYVCTYVSSAHCPHLMSADILTLLMLLAVSTKWQVTYKLRTCKCTVKFYVAPTQYIQCLHIHTSNCTLCADIKHLQELLLNHVDGTVWYATHHTWKIHECNLTYVHAHTHTHTLSCDYVDIANVQVSNQLLYVFLPNWDHSPQIW